MTTRFPGFLAPGRAIWPACLAFILIGTLSGCSDALAPDPASTGSPPLQSDLGAFVTTIAPTLRDGDAMLAVTAPGYGRWLFAGDEAPVIVDMVPEVPIQFFWRAVDGGPTLQARVTYRYGWNVADPDDPHDPGWVGPPAANHKMQQTAPRNVTQGAERLTIERWDGDRMLTRAVFELWSMPVAP